MTAMEEKIINWKGQSGLIIQEPDLAEITVEEAKKTVTKMTFFINSTLFPILFRCTEPEGGF